MDDWHIFLLKQKNIKAKVFSILVWKDYTTGQVKFKGFLRN